MPQTDFGPTDITQGSGAFFTAEFYDADGILTVPSGATLTVSYINTSNVSQIDTVTLALTDQFFTGTWLSSLASIGLATWNVFVTGLSTASQTGQIRVIDGP